MNAIIGTTALASATPMTNASGADPIFAEIEAHKVAYRAYSEAVEFNASLTSDDPRYQEADRATRAEGERLNQASLAFADVQPTTIAGLLALLDYVDAFNHRTWSYPSGHSSHFAWPYIEGEEDARIAAPVVLPFPYLVMNNIRRTLAALA